MTESPLRTVPTWKQEEVRHQPHYYAYPEVGDESLDTLRQHWLADLKARTPRVSPHTIIKYDSTFRHFLTSLRRRGQPVTVSSLTKFNVDAWVQEQREAALTDITIHSRISGLKAFVGKYLYRDMGLTTVDLLRLVTNRMPPDKPRVGLSEEEREAILGCFNRPTFVDIRDRAILAVCLATGLRFWEVMGLPLGSFDRMHGELTVLGKGNRTRTARLGTRALKYVRQYLTERPKTDCDRLWVTEDGSPLTYKGAHAIIYRTRKLSGVHRLTWHLMRHGFAQHALAAGAHQGLVQEMLGHTTPTMTRRYLGHIKQQEAARQMPQFAPI